VKSLRNKNYPYYKTEHVSNLKEMVDYVAAEYGDKPAFTFERNKATVSVSCRQFKSDIQALGTAFTNIGMSDSKIAVIGENSYEWILTYFATVNGGNVIVPLDKELPSSDIRNLIEESGAEMLVYSCEYSDVAEYLQEKSGAIAHYVDMQDLFELIKVGKGQIEDGKNTFVEHVVDNYKVAALLYTSGTTGNAKGVMLSHYGLARNAVAAAQHLELIGSNMVVLPLHHAFGFMSMCVTLLKGSEAYINASLKKVLSDFKEFKPHNISLVPLFIETFYNKIWEGAKKEGKENLLKKLQSISNTLMRMGIDVRRVLFKSVLRAFGGNIKMLVSGGAPLDPKYVEGLRSFGIMVLNGYGITECSPIVSVNRDEYFRDGSVGPVLPCCEVKILKPDENGNGEICVKGDTVMLGYYNNESATKEAFDGDWFKTGDIGRLDSDGFLYISGREKNLIILSNGKNVYPEELELALLNQIPYIKEAVVYAEDNIVVAEVFLDTENEHDCASRINNDIILFNKTQAAYKNIGRTVIRETNFPKTTTKKIKRNYNQEGK